jgi:hypothetical protein
MPFYAWVIAYIAAVALVIYALRLNRGVVPHTADDHGHGGGHDDGHDDQHGQGAKGGHH